MGRQQVDLRRAEILAAAATVVTRRGLGRTRVADVAAELGISPGLVFYHFPTKEMLLTGAFQVALDRQLQRVERAAARPGDPVDRLRALLGVVLPMTGSRGRWLPDVDLWTDTGWPPERDQLRREVVEHLRRQLRQVIDDGLTSGEFRCPDPEEVSLRIVVLRDGLAVASQVRGTLSEAGAARRLAEYTAELVGVPADRLMPAAELMTPPSPRSDRAR